MCEEANPVPSMPCSCEVKDLKRGDSFVKALDVRQHEEIRFWFMFWLVWKTFTH